MESDAPRGALRDIGSMGDDYDRGAIAMKFLEQRQDFFAGIAVECPRRLVCQKKCRTVYKRASDGNTLLPRQRADWANVAVDDSIRRDLTHP